MKLGATPTHDEAVEFAASEARAAAALEKKRVAEMLGIDESKLEAELSGMKNMVADGKAYRADLLNTLGKLTIKLEGNDEKGVAASERIKKVYASQELEDIKAEIVRLESRVTEVIPGGPTALEKSEQEKFFDTSNYG